MKNLFYLFICSALLTFSACEKEACCEIEEPSGIDPIPKECLGPIPEGVCSADLDPVCGCNSITYPNACAAFLAGVLTWTQGNCP